MMFGRKKRSQAEDQMEEAREAMERMAEEEEKKRQEEKDQRAKKMRGIAETLHWYRDGFNGEQDEIDLGTGLPRLPMSYHFKISEITASEFDRSNLYRLVELHGPEGRLEYRRVYFEREETEDEQRAGLLDAAVQNVEDFIAYWAPDLGVPDFSGVYPPNKL